MQKDKMRLGLNNLVTKALLVGAVSSLVLSGCATLSPAECQTTNWQALGKTDGARGALPSYIQKHTQACRKIGVTPHLAQWEAGRKEGLKDYCTEFNAYVVGRDGRALSPVCGFVGREKLMQMEQRFEEGRRVYRLERQIDDLRRDMYDHDRYDNWCWRHPKDCRARYPYRPYIW